MKPAKLFPINKLTSNIMPSQQGGLKMRTKNPVRKLGLLIAIFSQFIIIQIAAGVEPGIRYGVAWLRK